MLAGKSVRLRGVLPEDIPTLFELAAEFDNWEERTPAPPKPLARETFEEWISKNRDDPRHVDFVITADERIVGRCSLMREDPLARHAEVGIGLVADARGNGYGTDALRVLAEFAFTRRNLRRLHLSVLASNARAIASYRKVGFVEEGRRREHCWVRGAYDDEILMGLLRSEWR
jgi:RimJ/RimL family protein N-acetyltransferase